MIVYGDLHYEVMLNTLARRLRARVKAILESQAAVASSVEQLRALLILSGELEQAAHDALSQFLPGEEAQKQISLLHRVTACAANAFYSAYALKKPNAPTSRISTRAALAEMANALNKVCSAQGSGATMAFRCCESMIRATQLIFACEHNRA